MTCVTFVFRWTETGQYGGFADAGTYRLLTGSDAGRDSSGFCRFGRQNHAGRRMVSVTQGMPQRLVLEEPEVTSG